MREFTPHPLIALSKSEFDPSIHQTYYRYDYEQIFKDIAKIPKKDRYQYELSVYRSIILNDLWFILYFVMEIPDNKGVNHPFVVQRCQDVANGPKDGTLDVWARGHYKSTIITIAETIQYQLKNPEHATAIFSFKAAISKQNFLFEIKQTLENAIVLKSCFPDVIWHDPQRDAPMWSLDGGLVLKRTSNRKETSISAHGLIQGMPVGLHFERRIYDDIVTQDIGESAGEMEKVKLMYDVSQNLKTHMEVDTHRVVGTFYHHADPLVYIRDKKIAGTDNKKYFERKYPATDDGLPNGKSVFLTEEALNELRGDKTFFCQQLLNPTPQGTQALNSQFLIDIKPEDIPQNLTKIMIIDSAGDDDTNKSSGDDWSVMVASVDPAIDEIGASHIYITQLYLDVLSESQAPDLISRMYLGGGIIKQLGYERLGNITPGWLTQIDNIIKKAGRFFSLDKKLKLVRPLTSGGRNKHRRIESYVAWPLNNACIHISTAVSEVYRDKLRGEMDMFPYGNDNGLDTLAYCYEMLHDIRFDPPPKKNLYKEDEDRASEYNPLNYARRR